MDPATIAGVGSLFSGIGGIAGALFPASGVNQHKKKEKRLLAANIAATQQNTELQRRAYYYGIQDRVNDAIEAGIHPLFALGASTPSYGAASASGISYPYKESGPGRLASGLREAGIAMQDFARARADWMEAKASSAQSAAAADAIGPVIAQVEGQKILSDKSPQPSRAVVLPNGTVIAPQGSSPGSIAEEEFADAGSLIGAWRLADWWRRNRQWENAKEIGRKTRTRRHAAKKFHWKQDTRDYTKESYP